MNRITKNPFYFICLIVIIAYSSLLTGQSSVNPDAQIILANLSNYKNIGEYLVSLFSFNTIDFQPLRDLTFWIDLIFFNEFSFNTFTVQNLLWWIGSCWLVFQFLLKNFPTKNINLIFILVLAFSVYPLFSFTIPWGMARKHIIAFFFFLMAGNSVLSLNKANKLEIFKISIYYLLSLLGQPIAILFPFWIAYYTYFIKKFSKREMVSILLPIFILQVIFIVINYYYYSTSKTFLYFYAPKLYSGIELGDKLLALGHYHFQIFFPYLLSFTYSLGDISSILGLGMLVVLGLFFYKMTKNFLEIFSLLLPGVLVISLILSTPHQLYDTYLLIPTLSYFSLIVYFLPNISSKRLNGLICLLIIFWSVQTHFESKKWLNYVALTESSFERRPSCKNAINYARISYESGQSPNSNVKKFLTINECLKNVGLTEFSKVGHIIFLGNILFYEDFFTFEDRLKKLDELGKEHITAQLVKAALYIKNNKVHEADSELKQIIEKMARSQQQKNQFHAITAKVIHPYCTQKNWKECLDLSSKFNSQPNKPYL